MGALIYKVGKRLYSIHLIPWCVWSKIYDRFHRCVDDQWR